MKESAEKAVKQLIVDQLGVDADEVVPAAKIVDDLGADSLDIVELVMSVEEYYEIEISDEDADKLTTVGEIVDYVNAKAVQK